MLSEDTLFTDFNMASKDEATMKSTRSTVESKRPSDEFINEWKEQHSGTMQNKNKEKQSEMMEEKLGWIFPTPSKQHKDPNTSSVLSYDSNITEVSTNQNQQITSYKPNISEITTIQRPPITR